MTWDYLGLRDLERIGASRGLPFRKASKSFLVKDVATPLTVSLAPGLDCSEALFEMSTEDAWFALARENNRTIGYLAYDDIPKVSACVRDAMHVLTPEHCLIHCRCLMFYIFSRNSIITL